MQPPQPEIAIVEGAGSVGAGQGSVLDMLTLGSLLGLPEEALAEQVMNESGDSELSSLLGMGVRGSSPSC